MAGNAVLQTLRHVWLTLESMHVRAAVMGGMAMAAWKHVRTTRDVDLLVSIRADDVEHLLGQLRAAAIHPKDDRLLTSLGQLKLVRLFYQPPETFMDLQVDLLLSEAEYHEEALKRRVFTKLSDLDVQIAVLACEDLILHKLLAGRIIDRADVAALLRANRESLDFGYLFRWVSELELDSGLTEAWNEAFPGEPLPHR